MAYAHPTTPGLNLRDKPGMAGKIINQLSPTDALVIIRYSDDGQWVRVQVARTTDRGWVYRKDIKVEAPKPPPLPPPEPGPLDPPYVEPGLDGRVWLAIVAGLLVLVAAVVYGLR